MPNTDLTPVYFDGEAYEQFNGIHPRKRAPSAQSFYHADAK